MFYRLGKFPRRFPGREPFEVLYMRFKRARSGIERANRPSFYDVECNESPVAATGHTQLNVLPSRFSHG